MLHLFSYPSLFLFPLLGTKPFNNFSVTLNKHETGELQSQHANTLLGNLHLFIGGLWLYKNFPLHPTSEYILFVLASFHTTSFLTIKVTKIKEFHENFPYSPLHYSSTLLNSIFFHLICLPIWFQESEHTYLIVC